MLAGRLFMPAEAAFFNYHRNGRKRILTARRPQGSGSFFLCVVTRAIGRYGQISPLTFLPKKQVGFLKQMLPFPIDSKPSLGWGERGGGGVQWWHYCVPPPLFCENHDEACFCVMYLRTAHVCWWMAVPIATHPCCDGDGGLLIMRAAVHGCRNDWQTFLPEDGWETFVSLSLWPQLFCLARPFCIPHEHS